MCASPVEAGSAARAGQALGVRLAIWLGVWLVPGCVASALLLHLFTSEAWGTLLHALVLLALLLTLLLPVLPELLRNQPCPPRSLRLTAAAVAGVHLALLLFYVLAWGGHHFWGNWINLELAAAYLPQLPALLRALDIAPAWLLVVVALLAACWWGLWRLHRRLLGAVLQARAAQPAAVSQRTGLVLLLGLLGALMLLYRSYYLELDFWWAEPVRQAGHSASFGQAGMGIALSPAQLQAEQAVAAAYPPHPPTGRLRPLVLIIVDALRGDLTEVAGAPVPNTPFLASLHRQGQLQRVDDAYSVCTVSYCGILGTLASRPWHRMTPQPWGLADALARLGYESRFYLSGDHSSFYGLRTMYGGAPGVVVEGGSQRARYSNDDRLVLDALDTHGWPRDRPGFLYVHLMSVHRLGSLEPAHRRWTAADAPTFSRLGTQDPREGAETRARYHNGILQADAMVAQIFQRLDRLGVLDDALVIITADHGDALGEGGRWSHGLMPYEPVVRIPLLVFDRHGRTPLAPRRLASHTDVAPTFLHAIGAPVPAHWTGVPLQLPLQRDALVLSSAEADGLVADDGSGRWKYLRPRDGAPEQLYRLDSAAGEAADLAGRPDHAGMLQRLRQQHTSLVAEPR